MLVNMDKEVEHQPNISITADMRRWQTEVQLAQDWDSQDKVDNNRVLAVHVREWSYRFKDVH